LAPRRETDRAKSGEFGCLGISQELVNLHSAYRTGLNDSITKSLKSEFEERTSRIIAPTIPLSRPPLHLHIAQSEIPHFASYRPAKIWLVTCRSHGFDKSGSYSLEQLGTGRRDACETNEVYVLD